MNDQEAARLPEPPRPPLDPMFPQLVKEADTPEQKLIGFIAYGLYEEARREWAAGFRDQEGHYPAENDLRAYERSWTASRLEGVRNAAMQLAAAYADTVSSQIEAEVLHRALKGLFWRGVGRWLFSAVIYTVAVLGAIVALGRFGIDPIREIRDFATLPGAPRSAPTPTPAPPAAPPEPAHALPPPPAPAPVPRTR